MKLIKKRHKYPFVNSPNAFLTGMFKNYGFNKDTLPVDIKHIDKMERLTLVLKLLEEGGYIEHREDIADGDIPKPCLTMKGILYAEKIIERRKQWTVTLFTIIVSVITLAASLITVIITLINHFHH